MERVEAGRARFPAIGTACYSRRQPHEGSILQTIPGLFCAASICLWVSTGFATQCTPEQAMALLERGFTKDEVMQLCTSPAAPPTSPAGSPPATELSPSGEQAGENALELMTSLAEARWENCQTDPSQCGRAGMFAAASAKVATFISECRGGNQASCGLLANWDQTVEDAFGCGDAGGTDCHRRLDPLMAVLAERPQAGEPTMEVTVLMASAARELCGRTGDTDDCDAADRFTRGSIPGLADFMMDCADGEQTTCERLSALDVVAKRAMECEGQDCRTGAEEMVGALGEAGLLLARR